jgi:hypothetical protein
MTAARRPIPSVARRDFRFPSRAPVAAAAAAAGFARGAVPPTAPSGPLRGRALAAVAVLLAVLIPAACGERRDGARLAALEAGIASARASLAALSAGAPAAPPPAGAPSFRPVGTASIAVAAAPSSAGARPLAASGLVGAGPDALRRWFGDPDLRRREGDAAEVLLFLGPGCALDVVLYAEAAGGGGAMRVAHAAARADGAAAVTEADCLRGVGGGGVGRAAAAGHSARR